MRGNVAAALGCLCSIYVFIRFPDLSQQMAEYPWDGLVVSGIMIVLFLEGLRRTSGLVLTMSVLARPTNVCVVTPFAVRSQVVRLSGSVMLT